MKVLFLRVHLMIQVFLSIKTWRISLKLHFIFCSVVHICDDLDFLAEIKFVNKIKVFYVEILRRTEADDSLISETKPGHEGFL